MSVPKPIPSLVDLYRMPEPLQSPEPIVRLDRNERQQPLPEWFMDLLRQSLDSSLLTNYPSQAAFLKQLAASLGIPVNQLLLTAGSDAAVKAIYQTYVQADDQVLMLAPSYAMYPVYAEMFQAKAVQIGFNKQLVPDIELLLQSIQPGVKLVILANPNQPTGTLLDTKVLLQIIQTAAAVGALVAIDEAYYPFSRTTVLPWLQEHPHLLVIRTLSKATGLAGLRIGFIAGQSDIISNLYKVRSAYDVNSMALLCASQMLKHEEVIEDYVTAVEAGAKVLSERAVQLGLIPWPTSTNFMLIQVAHRVAPAQIVEELRQLGYLVKGSFDALCLADCIRVTLGPPDLMSQFSDSLRQALEKLSR